MHHIVRAKASTSSDSGPMVDSRTVIDILREQSDADDTTLVPVRSLLEHAWQDLADALAVELGELSPTVAASLTRLQRIDQLLSDRLDAKTGVEARLADVVSRLEAAPCVTGELVTLAPQLICELGFDRAIISRIDERLWISECVYVADDPEWASEINRAGQENPQILGPQILETEIVRRREGLLVTDVQSDTRVNRPIADASGSRSYVAAPVVSEGRVVGLLHADKYRHSTDVGEEECQLLIGFAQSLRLALSRARMSEDTGALRSGLSGLADSVDATVSGAHTLCVRRSEPPVETAGTPTAAQRTPTSRGPSTRVADAGLTARESEVLALMAQGRTNAAIAHELVISEGTVKQHVKHVLRKLRAGNRSEATSMWFNEPGHD
ncbi:LuxR C-terminal-related transcriptional regulator [Gordonia otitidis]|nr:LuxR C-terminal-related transcriptional regulator [Gordonia otitidis]